MTEKNDWTNDEILYFLECYRQEPCIWNPEDRGHKDKKKIADAWNRLSEVLNKTVKELKMKKEILMVTFRKHLKRKTESIRSGSGDIYQPIWFAYGLMESFLQPVYANKSSTNTGTESQGQRNSQSYYIHPATSLFSSMTPYTSLAKKKPIQTPIAKPIKLLPCNFSLNKNNSSQEDKFLNLAKVWAMKLKNLQPTQRKLAEKAINDVLFEAEMETLHRDSVKINIPRNPSVIPSGSPPSTSTPSGPSLVLQESHDLGQDSQKHEQESQDGGENVSEITEASSFSAAPNPPPAKKQKVEDPIPKQNEPQEASDFPLNKNNQCLDGEYLNLAKVWVYKIKNLQPIQKKLAEKAINDILFEAEMETLQWDSVEINMTGSDAPQPS